MTINVKDFQPSLNYTVSASTSNATQTLAQPTGAGQGYNRIRIFNNSAAVAFVKWGNGTQTAVEDAIDCVQVGAGAIETFEMGSPYRNVGVILASGASSGSVYLSAGT